MGLASMSVCSSRRRGAEAEKYADEDRKRREEATSGQGDALAT